ncbi:MAG TPA: PDZ domain-containing protein [Terriglobales bacterium]|nr:PDZ domain-containing protein [Terriglobales bacterium]
MIRTLATALLLAGMTVQVGHAATQPETQPKAAPNPYAYAQSAGHSYLGVDIRDVTHDRMSALNLKEERGVEITMVDGDAPAGKAGLRERDVILGFNGMPVESEEQLRRLIRETPPGRTVSIDLSRAGNPMKVSVQLADRGKIAAEALPRVQALPRFPEFAEGPNRIDIPVFTVYSSSLGMQTENLTRQLGDFFGVKNGEGVLVRNVERGSAAEKAGLRAGDVIVKVADEKLSDRTDLVRILRKRREGGKLSVVVMRDKKEQNLTIAVPARGTKDSSSIDLELQGLDSELARLETLPSDMLTPEMLKQWSESAKSFTDGMAEFGNSMQEYDLELKDLDRELLDLDRHSRFDILFHDMI